MAESKRMEENLESGIASAGGSANPRDLRADAPGSEKVPNSKIVCPACGHNLSAVIASLIRQRGRFKGQREEARREARQWKNNHDSVADKKRVAERFRDSYRGALKEILAIHSDDTITNAQACDRIEAVADAALNGSPLATGEGEASDG